MKKVLLFILLLVSTVAAQQTDVDKAYAWLIGQPNTDVFTASLTTLAINNADSTRTSSYINYIKLQFNPTENCWPKGGCTVRNTALALIIESKIGLNIEGKSSQQLISDVEKWLIKRQTLAGLNGRWELQIITPESGTCSLKYQKRDEAESRTFDLAVNDGKISYGNCRDQNFFNLNSCLGVNLADKPSTRVEVSCANNFDNARISLIYREGNTIYLVSEPATTRAAMWISNGFFGNKLDTLYADWALKTINSKVNSLIYLKKNAENKVVDNALLYLSTLDNSYANKLASLTTGFGNFRDQDGEKEFDNGIGALAIKTSGQHTEILDGVKIWLSGKQKPDGSWLSDAKTTAMVLYGAFEGGNLPEDGDGGVEPECESDNDCEEGSICVNGECVSESPPDCALSNPKWLNKFGVEITQATGNAEGRKRGDTVILSVSGEDCDDTSISFSVFEDEPGQDQSIGTLGPVEFNVQEATAIIEFSPLWFDDNPLPLVEDDPEYYFVAKITGSSSSSQNSPLLIVKKPPEIGTKECNDDEDNDGDGKTDWPEDPGCFDANDDTEGDICNSNWRCAPWSPACETGADTQTRTCADENECGPPCSGNATCLNERSCSDCVPTWQCTDWSICFDNAQIRSCRDITDCGFVCEEGDENCVEERECFVDAGDEDEEDEDLGDETDGERDEEEEETLICFINGLCETEFGENSENCIDDCPLPREDDGLPDIQPPDEDDFDGGDLDGLDSDRARGGNTIWIILIVILLLAVLAAVYFFLVKKPKGNKGRPTFSLPSAPKREPLFGPQQPKTQSYGPTRSRPGREEKSKLDSALEKSLKEARKLLGK